ncbi:MAG: response regulator transcription factor [Anaerolineae bacterium]|nr:response regulator transcription factor [Anaerolineae bacterium]
MNPLKLLLVDDHEVVRMGLRLIIEQTPDLEIVGEAGTAQESIRLCELHHPHVVIMDIRMQTGTSGIDACRTIMERFPNTKVIMLTSYADDALIADAIKAGAVGYVLKQGGTGELLRALEAVRQGAALLDPEITRRVLTMLREQNYHQTDPFRELTVREIEVLRLVAEGKSNGDIALALVLSDKTVRNHMSIIFDKLHVNNRVEAAAYAIKHEIFRYSRSG